MWIPFRKSKNAVKAAAQPRDEIGKFVAPQKQPTIDQAIEKETKAVTNVLDLLTAVRKMAADENALIDSKVQSALEGYESDEPDGQINQWIPLLQQIAPVISPYIPSIMERFGIKPIEASFPSPVAQAPSPAAQALSPAAQENLLIWINRAAEASPNLIKPFIPKLLEEVEKQGIPPDRFKQAIINISKAI